MDLKENYALNQKDKYLERGHKSAGVTKSSVIRMKERSRNFVSCFVGRARIYSALNVVRSPKVQRTNNET